MENKIYAILYGGIWVTIVFSLLIFSQSFMVSERNSLLKETLMPVYAALEDEQLLYMYEEVRQAAVSRTSSIIIRGKTNSDSVEYVCQKTYRFTFNSPEKPVDEREVEKLKKMEFPFVLFP